MSSGQKRLKWQFRQSLEQARRVLQLELVDYLKSNPLVAAEFIRALRLDELREAEGCADVPPLWSGCGDGWELLPRMLGSKDDDDGVGSGSEQAAGAKLPGHPPRIFYPSGGSRRDRLDTGVAAAAFGMWLYLFDPAEATYYYPFPDSNLIFGAPRSPFTLWPVHGHQKRLSTFLSDYRLMIGEGSQGVAARGARSCVLPSTFADVRGSVALEDLLLRNFVYLAFPLFASEDGEACGSGEGTAGESRRAASKVPFAYTALIYPVPLPPGSQALDRVAAFLETDFVPAAKAIFEPLVSHVQDYVIATKQRELTRTLAQSLEGHSRFNDTCREFANILIRAPSAVEGAEGLRDPFAFAGIHVVPPPDVRKSDMRAVRYYPNSTTISVMLRGRFEQEHEPRILEDEPGGVLEPEAGFRAALSALANGEGYDGSNVGVDPVASYSGGVKAEAGTNGSTAREAFVQIKLVAVHGEGSEPDTQRCWQGSEVIEGFFENLLGGLADRVATVRRWLGDGREHRAATADSPHPWAEFDDSVLYRKIHDASCRAAGRVLATALATGSRSEADKALGELKYLSTLMEGDLVPADRLDEAVAAAAKMAEASSKASAERVTAAALVTGDDCALVDAECDGGVHWHKGHREKLRLTLRNASVRRILAVVARRGFLIPARPGALHRRALVSPWLGKGGAKGGPLDARLSSRAGIDPDSGEPFNYSLLTTLSDPWLWRTHDGSGSSSLLTTFPFPYIYWFDLGEEEAGRRSTIVALGPALKGSSEEQSAVLDDLVRSVRKLDSDVDQAQLKKLAIDLVEAGRDRGPAVCTKWVLGDRTRLNWNVLYWLYKRADLERAFSSAPIDAAEEHLAPVRELLRHCEGRRRDAAEGRRRVAVVEAKASTTTRSFCFPEIVYTAWSSGAESVLHGSGGDAESKRCSECDVQAGRGPCSPCEAEPLVRAGVSSLLNCTATREESPLRLDRGESPHSTVFDASWGARRHLVWPIQTKDRPEADDYGFFVFSAQVPPMVDPLGEARCPFLMGESHHGLLAGAVEYVNFMLQQERWKIDLGRQAAAFVHDSKNDWFDVQLEMKSRRGKRMVARVLARHNADLREYSGQCELSAVRFKTAKELALWIKLSVTDRLTSLIMRAKKELGVFANGTGVAFKPCLCGSSESFPEKFFPLDLPWFTIQAAIQELVLNAFKYSLLDPGSSLLRVELNWLADGEKLEIAFVNIGNGGVPNISRRTKIGLDVLRARLERNLGKGAFIVPPKSDLREEGRTHRFVLKFNPWSFHELVDVSLDEELRVTGTKRSPEVFDLRGERTDEDW